MSKYTTEVRYICENAAGLKESTGLNDVKAIVTTACPKIFDDDIPFFDERYRLPLECKILMHYYTREISGETVGLWKLWLNNRMREIMPYYNQLYESTLLEFNPLFTKNIREEYTGEGLRDGTKYGTIDGAKDSSVIANKNDTGSFSKTGNKSGNKQIDSEHENTIEDVGSTTAHNESTDTATDRRLYSDTPQGALTGVENETYLTNATKNIGSDVVNGNSTLESSNTNTNNGTNGETETHAETNTEGGTENKTENTTATNEENVTEKKQENTSENSTENFIRTITGYEGVSPSKLLNEFRETILNIDVKIIEELSDLFFNLW